jgi:hypothetical protein
MRVVRQDGQLPRLLRAAAPTLPAAARIIAAIARIVIAYLAMVIPPSKK